MADFEYITINTTAQKIEKMANLETTYSTEAGKIPIFSQANTIRSGTPKNSMDCANKKYVDDAIANAGGGSANLSNYYTKDEVDNLDAVKSIENEDYNTKIKDPQGRTILTLSGEDEIVDANGYYISNVRDPLDSTDAATKGYVDGLIGDIETLLGGI